MKKVLLTVLMICLTLTMYAQNSTQLPSSDQVRSQIDSWLELKTSFSRDEVLTLLTDLAMYAIVINEQTVIEERERARKIAEEAVIEAIRPLGVQIRGLESERNTWLIIGLVEAGMIVTGAIIYFATH